MISKEIEIIYKMIKDLGFLAMAEEFKDEPGKREQIIQFITRAIRREQNNENANRFYSLGMESIKRK